MKKYNLYSLAFFILTTFSFSQSKKEILLEVKSYIHSKVININYDKPRKEVYEAMRSVVISEYPELSRESLEKGYVEGIYENNEIKEKLGFEIIGNAQPYRINVFFEKNVRDVFPNGSFGSWRTGSEMSYKYNIKIHKALYELIYGKLIFSEELINKIDRYNSTQTKDKNKILAGRDY